MQCETRLCIAFTRNCLSHLNAAKKQPVRVWSLSTEKHDLFCEYFAKEIHVSVALKSRVKNIISGFQKVFDSSGVKHGEDFSYLEPVVKKTISPKDALYPI